VRAKSINPLGRKSIELLRQMPRYYTRMFSAKEDYIRHPPVICNSIPKSGTHLLFQILQALPDVKNYGTFIASMPPIRFRRRSHKDHLRLIRAIIPGEIVRAHLFFHEDFAALLKEMNIAQYMIIRDPRDVAISEAHYLSYMSPWHRMHKHFKAIRSWDDRISKSILGFEDPDFPFDFPDISRRFVNYLGWLSSSDVYAVKYEDLMSAKRGKVLIEITEFYSRRTALEFDVQEVARRMEANIRPEKSHTFREGGAGKWREVLSQEHREQLKEVAGDLLIELGYERDLNW